MMALLPVLKFLHPTGMTIDGGKDLHQRDEIALGEVVLQGLGVAFLQHRGADAKAPLFEFDVRVLPLEDVSVRGEVLLVQHRIDGSSLYSGPFINMKIFAFVSGKGGVGKTTLGFLLGLVLQRAQRRVNFLDLDPQASLTSLLELHNVKRDVGAATEFLIVDTPPRLESKEVRESVQRADVICIPMRPSPMDFGVTTNTAELVKTLKRPDSKAFIILNQLRKGTYWSKKVETLNGSDFALSFANSSFSLRECFAHALTVGWDALDESASNELLNFALTIG